MRAPLCPFQTCALLLAAQLALAGTLRAQPPKVVVLLADAAGDAQAREHALRLELDARGITLLLAEPIEATPPPGAVAPSAPPSPEAWARKTLQRTAASAVVWLEGDPNRPVSWVRVIYLDREALDQAPLPHPPAAIAPDLFAIAAANLLERGLQPPPPASASSPGLEPPGDAALAPAAVAAQAPAAPNAAAPAPARATPKPRSTPQSEEPRPKRLRDWFVQAALVLSIAHVTSGMEAATSPKREQILTTVGDRSFFNGDSPWIPDRDSFDDFEDAATGVPRGTTPFPGNCEADGIATGPIGLPGPDGKPFTEILPSRYCVRVYEPGFALLPALRLAVGRWLLPTLALSVLYEGYFGVDAASFFGNQLFGVQGELRVLGARAGFVTLSVTAAFTAGRTETPVPPQSAAQSINALSGPIGVRAGPLLRLWPTDVFALFSSLTVGERLPDTQLLFDLAAGAEVPF